MSATATADALISSLEARGCRDCDGEGARIEIREREISEADL